MTTALTLAKRQRLLKEFFHPSSSSDGKRNSNKSNLVHEYKISVRDNSIRYLLSLPEVIIYFIFSDYLDLSDVCRFDSAICNHLYRPQYLMLIQKMTFRHLDHKKNFLSLFDLSIAQWLQRKHLAFENIILGYDIYSVYEYEDMHFNLSINPKAIVNLRLVGYYDNLSKLKQILSCGRLKSFDAVLDSYTPYEWGKLCTMLIKLINPLEKLRINYELYDQDLLDIVEKYPTLKSIDVESTEITDESISILGTLCPLLTNLSLGGCFTVTSQGLIEFFRSCPQLESFTFHVRYFHLEREEFPYQDDGDALNDASLAALGVHCPNLKRLDIAVGWLADDIDVGLFAFAEGCKNLEELKIYDMGFYMDADSVSSAGLTAVAMSSTKLRKLTLESLFNLEGDELIAFGVNCPLLESLIIDGAYNIPTHKLVEFGYRATCHNLQELAISLAAVDNNAVFTITSNCRNLKTITFELCDRISDISLLYISQHCLQLQTISLIDSSGIIDSRSVLDFMGACRRNSLRDIYLDGICVGDLCSFSRKRLLPDCKDIINNYFDSLGEHFSSKLNVHGLRTEFVFTF